MKLIKMNLMAGIACLGVLTWCGFAQAVLLDDFADGDYTANPTWSIAGNPTHPANPAYWSVAASPTTGSLALRHEVPMSQGWHTAILQIEDIGTQNFELSATINTEVANGRQFIIIGGPNGDGSTSYGDRYVLAELNYTSGAWKMNLANSGGDESGYGDSLGFATRWDMCNKDYRYTFGRKDGVLYFDLDDLATPEVEEWHRELAETAVTDLTDSAIQLVNSLGSAFLDYGILVRYFDDIALDISPPGVFPPGDTDRNNKVDEANAATLARNWLASGVGIGWADGDFNNDDVVNDIDAAMMAANWHVGVTAAGSVPEPSCLVLLIGAVAAGVYFLRKS